MTWSSSPEESGAHPPLTGSRAARFVLRREAEPGADTPIRAPRAAGHLSLSVFPDGDTNPEPARPSDWTATRAPRRGTPARVFSTGLLALAALALGSCDSATTLEVTEYCAEARRPFLSNVSVTAFEDLAPRSAVLVVEESTAPGCQPWDWNGDHTACINATIAHAHRSGAKYVGLTRGQHYRYSDRIFVLPNTVLTAVGDPALDRPILATDVPVPDGISLGSGAEIRNLDIRGPHYNRKGFPVQKHGDWLYKGINGATSSGWSVLGTSVNGFAGTGILAAQSHDIRIEGSTISHNGYSGVSLFQGDDNCGRGVRFVGNLVEYNGQDGIDTCSSDALFSNNTIRFNGWDRNAGDRHGLLVFAWSEGGAERIEISNNMLYGNGETGIRIAGNSVTEVVIRGNYMTDNGHWGLDLGAPGGVLASVDVRDNSCGRNRLGCLNKEHLWGVQVTENTCFQ